MLCYGNVGVADSGYGVKPETLTTLDRKIMNIAKESFDWKAELSLQGSQGETHLLLNCGVVKRPQDT